MWTYGSFTEPALSLLLDIALNGSVIAGTVLVLTRMSGLHRARLRGALLNIGVVFLLVAPTAGLVSLVAGGPPSEAVTFAEADRLAVPLPVDGSAFPMAGVVALYAAGVLFCLARFGVATARLARLTRSLTPLEDPVAVAALGRASKRVHVERPVRLATSPSVPGPCQLGILRPTVVLPAGRSYADLDAVLLHELIHVGRFDCLWKVLGALVAAAHWFNPLVWRVVANASVVQDQVCDDWVVHVHRSPDRYVETLVSVVRGFRPRSAFACRLDMANGSGLLERIERIRASRGRRPDLGASGRTLSVTTACVLLLTAGSLRVIVAPGQAEPPKPDVAAVAPSVLPEAAVSKAHQPHARTRPGVVRPTVALASAARAPDTPDAWLSPDILALAETVEPLDPAPAPPALRVTNEDVMIYPEPWTYAAIADHHRLIAPAGATYRTELTMGAVIGTTFGSRAFYGDM